MSKIYKKCKSEILFEDDLLSLESLIEKHKQNLRFANLSGVDLSGMDLSGANLSHSDLSGVNLSGVNLSHSDLRGANLWGSDLRGANLWGTYLSGVNLSGANLWGTYLSGVNLSGVNLRGAKLSDKTILNYKEVGLIGSQKRLLRCFLLNNDSFYFMVGCFDGTEQELKERVINKYGANCEYIEAIEFLKNLCIKYKG